MSLVKFESNILPHCLVSQMLKRLVVTYHQVQIAIRQLLHSMRQHHTVQLIPPQDQSDKKLNLNTGQPQCFQKLPVQVLTISIVRTSLQCTLFECQCIQQESTNWGHYFHVPNGRRDRHFTWTSEPREGLAACKANEVPSFLSYLKTPRIGPSPRIEPATSRSATKLSTD